MNVFQKIVIKLLGIDKNFNEINSKLESVIEDSKNFRSILENGTCAGIEMSGDCDTIVAIISKFNGGKLQIIDNIVIRSESEWNSLIEYISKQFYVGDSAIAGKYYEEGFRRINVPQKTFNRSSNEIDN